MASITVDVDVDLDEFDLDDILEEIEDRYSHKRGRSKEIIDEWAKDFFAIEPINKNIRLSILDEMKIDLLMRNLDKIKLNDLENLI